MSNLPAYQQKGRGGRIAPAAPQRKHPEFGILYPQDVTNRAEFTATEPLLAKDRKTVRVVGMRVRITEFEKILRLCVVSEYYVSARWNSVYHYFHSFQVTCPKFRQHNGPAILVAVINRIYGNLETRMQEES